MSLVFSYFGNMHSIDTFIKNLFNGDVLITLLVAYALDSSENCTGLPRRIREKK